MAATFAHIVNPFATEDSALQRIHQVTFRSLEQAVACSASDAIELLSAQYETDRGAVPPGVHQTYARSAAVCARSAQLCPKEAVTLAGRMC
jgi:hypothetical protein